MTSDLTKPLLRIHPSQPTERTRGVPRNPPSPLSYSIQEQKGKFGPKFTRLAEVLQRDESGLEVHSDPSSIAPERLLVFELNGEVQNFANAIRKVDGLQLVDEEELIPDESAKNPRVYLLIPDDKALGQIHRLWEHWSSGEKMPDGFAPWRDVFQTLRDLRPWGPHDRVSKADHTILAGEIEGLENNDKIKLEIELIYRPNNNISTASQERVIEEITRQDGDILSMVRIDEISYHAILVEVSIQTVNQILSHESISSLDPVQHIRPQSISLKSSIADESSFTGFSAAEVSDTSILALLDGVPVSQHPLLSNHLNVDDIFDLEPNTTVTNRRHGTAMASLIIHGDRNNNESPLPRKIHTIPVLGENDEFPENKLIVDITYQAIYSMLDGESPSAPHVTIINLSLGNKYRPFHGQLSPWARLIDTLSYKYGVLFLVSAGNITDNFELAGYTTRTAFEDDTDEEKVNNTITAIDKLKAERRLLSPAETVNGLTIGAINKDSIPDPHRRSASMNINPYPSIEMVNPSSALGPGFANSVKPELILPGSRENLNVINTYQDEPITVSPVGPSRAAGLKVAAPPISGDEAFEGYTNGTSAATALASRTAHRIHDALENEYGDDFLSLPKKYKAALLKALLVHPASWPEETALIIKSIIGPADGKQHVKQKDNIRRFLGYGTHDLETAVACANDRATFWAVAELGTDQSISISVPIPVAIANKQQYHSISSTLAWITPTNNGSQRYRAVRLKLESPDSIKELGVTPSKTQPDHNQINRGTVATRKWEGKKSAVVGDQDTLTFKVERQPDSGLKVDDNAIFAVAITISMPGVNEIYDQVRDMVRPRAAQSV